MFLVAGCVDLHVPTQQAAGLQDVRFLGMKRLSLASGSVSEKALAAFLEDRVNGLKEVSVSFSAGEAAAVGRLRGVRVACRVGLALAEDRGSLTSTAKGLSIGGFPVPLSLLGRRASFTRDFKPDAELPFEIRLPGLDLSEGRLALR
ncbi:MAG: hypothetical protein AAB339_02750 [Elusimicrobiota bacterium]